jgi:hypothetical protein
MPAGVIKWGAFLQFLDEKKTNENECCKDEEEIEEL